MNFFAASLRPPGLWRRSLALAPILALAGCLNVPPPSATRGTLGENLASHVAFLSQPKLGGRKPRTRGSRAARQYISARFEALGLTPWGEGTQFEQSFGYGRNVVGVLPGADPVLSREIVLVSAHYDHLGKNGQGQVCPGAADNAAGVAVLLETARQLTAPGRRPKRSVAFAAFDCEETMLLGSFAFAVRPDVEHANIVAVVNADMLGRDFMDVVPHTLFVAGTENESAIRKDIKKSGEAAGLRVLPLGTDLVGPRSDHVAFETRGVPCLFFSSGTCKDYHQPTDTPDKLNYADLESSAKVILAAVDEFANRPETPRKILTGSGDPAAATALPRGNREAAGSGLAKDSKAGLVGFDAEELETIKTVMSEVSAHREAAGLRKEDAQAFGNLEREAEALLQSGRYDREARARLISDATGILAPYLLPGAPPTQEAGGEQGKEFAMGLQWLQQFYAMHRKEVLEGYSKLVAEIVKYRPGPFRSMPEFNQELYTLDDQDIRLSETGTGTWSLHAMENWLSLRAGSKTTKWLVKSFGGSMVLGLNAVDCEGTRRQLEDFCLLRWRARQTNETYAAATRKLFRAITGTASEQSYPERLAERLRKGGFHDETDWIVSCILSDSAELALAGLGAGAKDPRTLEAARQVLLNREARGDVRAAAIDAAGASRDRTVLEAFCEVLNDPTPAYVREYTALFRKDYPFSDRVWVRKLRPVIERQMKASPKASQTIGSLARAELKKAAKKDYGPDPARWRKWVQSL
jgi:Peptidase family M28